MKRIARHSLRAAAAMLAMLHLAGGAAAQQCDYGISNVNFGAVDTLSGGAVDVSADVTVTCRTLLALLFPVQICINLNAGSGGSTGSVRHLSGPGAGKLDYMLYQDAARSVPWGSRTQPQLGAPVEITFNALSIGIPETRTRTIYARLLPGQASAPEGAYSSVFSGAQVEFNMQASLLTPPSCTTVSNNPSSASFTVSANVMANCNITAHDLDFGQHGILDSAVDATGQLDVVCTPGTSYAISMNNGLNGDGPTQRRMMLGGQSILYGLYKDSARSQPWGSSGGEVLTGTGTGTTVAVPVHGRVPPQATPGAGLYSDTVVVTITY